MLVEKNVFFRSFCPKTEAVCQACDYISMPYSKISVFSVETSGVLDLDSELEMYFSGLGKVKFEFTGNSDIVKIGRIIGEFAL